MDNIIKIANGVMICNGGNPLEGCPKDFKEADAWADAANENKNEHSEPKWSFDCGFKLDFDGPILNVSSRFYPPKTHYGPKWDGTVTVFLMGEEVLEKKFECDTLEQLKEEVEVYVKNLVTKVDLSAQDSPVVKYEPGVL
jgi:hypothetical protein